MRILNVFYSATAPARFLYSPITMPRKRNVYNTELPYHITGRTNNGAFFPCDPSEAWEIYSNALWFYSRIFNIKIYAFVMMGNHFHLLLLAPDGNLSEFMMHFMKKTSDEIRFINNVENHLYGQPFSPTLIESNEHFLSAFKYIHQNPVRAGICSSVFDYAYSTIHGFLGQRHEIIPIYDGLDFFENLNENLLWLDEKLETSETNKIREYLKRQQVKPKRNKNGYKDDTLSLF